MWAELGLMYRALKAGGRHWHITPQIINIKSTRTAHCNCWLIYLMVLDFIISEATI